MRFAGILTALCLLSACDGRESALEVQPGLAASAVLPTPTDLRTSVGGRRVIVQWLSGSDEHTHFILEKSRRWEGVWTVTNMFGIDPPVSSGGSHLEVDIPQGEVLRYRVAACNDVGCSAFTRYVSAVVPYAPRGPSAVFAFAVSDTTVAVQWNDQSSNESHFIILGSDDPSSLHVLGSTPPNHTEAVTRNLVPHGLQSGRFFYFAVEATNGGGFAVSDTVSVFMPTSPPAPPDSLNLAAIAPNTVRIRWPEMGSKAAEVRLLVRHAVAGGWSAWEPLTYLRGDATRYIHADLKSGGRYQFAIRACNYLGCSAPTKSGVVTVP